MLAIKFVSVLLLALIASSLPVLSDFELRIIPPAKVQSIFRLCSSHSGCGDFQHNTEAIADTVSAFVSADNGYLSLDVEPFSLMSEVTHIKSPEPFSQWAATTIKSEDEIPIKRSFQVGGASLTFTLEVIFWCGAALLALIIVLGLSMIKCIPYTIGMRTLLSSCEGHFSWTVAQSIWNKKSVRLPYFGVYTPAPILNIPVTTSSGPEDDSEDEKFNDTLRITQSLTVHEILPPNSPSANLFLSHITPKPGLSPDDRSRPPQGCTSLTLDPEIHELPIHSSRTLQVVTPGPTPLLSRNIYPLGRAYRVVLQCDIALGMKLWSGFGVAADSVWMMRFLMAIFGWFAITLTGSR